MTPRTTYYSFNVNGRRTGLFRRVVDETRRTLTDERLDAAGNWIVDPSLARHFRDTTDVVEVDAAEAAEIATGYGATL